MKSEDTDVPFAVFKIAWANSGAVGTLRILWQTVASFVIAIESVITNYFIDDLKIRLTAENNYAFNLLWNGADGGNRTRVISLEG